ncbi:hypothetical protein [Pseudonocardia sp. ICBG1293]|uniref:hypothetical protein n=1 Tax=Pseudonocardia sp. ICBG1293 TaxID=2844382 RepID=UPI001CCCAEBF|nr:hypothetical protein [Pseudonocardia sp. ICBG1293]
MSALQKRVSTVRKRPVELIGLDVKTSGLSGLWVETAEIDLVVYEASAGFQHRIHIVAHEFAHMLCGHTSTKSMTDQVIALLFPDLDPTFVRGMLGRGGYDDRDEQEAEVVATVLLERLARNEQPTLVAPWCAETDALKRISRSLRRDWLER